MDLNLIVSIGVEIVGFAVGYGVLKQTIKDQGKEIVELKTTQKDLSAATSKIQTIEANIQDHSREIQELNISQRETNEDVKSINNQLAGINAKLDLIIEGKVNFNKE